MKKLLIMALALCWSNAFAAPAKTIVSAEKAAKVTQSKTASKTNPTAKADKAKPAEKSKTAIKSKAVAKADKSKATDKSKAVATADKGKATDKPKAVAKADKGKATDKSKAVTKADKGKATDKSKAVAKADKGKATDNSKTIAKADKGKATDNSKTVAKADKGKATDKSKAVAKSDKTKATDKPKTVAKSDKGKVTDKSKTIAKADKGKATDKSKAVAQASRSRAPDSTKNLAQTDQLSSRALAKASQPQATPLPKGAQKSRESLLSQGRNLIGTPYRWGGTSPKGFDCSGLVHYLYSKQGIFLPRSSRDQFTALPAVEQPQPGDLVFFRKRGVINHVGIYVGDGKMLHAPQTGSHVRIESMEKPNWQRRYAGARRALKGGNAVVASAKVPATSNTRVAKNDKDKLIGLIPNKNKVR